jgi:hypothetical protein
VKMRGLTWHFSYFPGIPTSTRLLTLAPLVQFRCNPKTSFSGRSEELDAANNLIIGIGGSGAIECHGVVGYGLSSQTLPRPVEKIRDDIDMTIEAYTNAVDGTL